MPPDETYWYPPSFTVAAVSEPITISRPLLLITALLASPPERTVIPPEPLCGLMPVLVTDTLRARPPEETTNVPAPDMVEPEAVPADRTTMCTPSAALLLPVYPESMMMVPPELTVRPLTTAPPYISMLPPE